MSKRKTYAITPIHNDGFGSQYLAKISGMAWCYYHRDTHHYIHTPFTSISHNTLAKEMNEFIGVPLASAELRNPKKINIIEKYNEKVLWSKTPENFYTEPFLNIIRKYYNSTKKPDINELSEIAIHIRRGDVHKNAIAKIKCRFTDNNFYKQLIQYFLIKYPSYKITIYSEGTPNDFKDLIFDDNVSLCLNTDTKTTFHYLVSSKILVTAISSFSYAAALLNTNTIYYVDFWHSPLPNWINCKKIISQMNNNKKDFRLNLIKTLEPDSQTIIKINYEKQLEILNRQLNDIQEQIKEKMNELNIVNNLILNNNNENNENIQNKTEPAKETNYTTDVIWSKGPFRNTYSEKNSEDTATSESDIIKLINSSNGFIWLRNGSGIKNKDLVIFSNLLDKIQKPITLITTDGVRHMPSSIPRKVVDKILNSDKISKWHTKLR